MLGGGHGDIGVQTTVHCRSHTPLCSHLYASFPRKLGRELPLAMAVEIAPALFRSIGSIMRRCSPGWWPVVPSPVLTHPYTLFGRHRDRSQLRPTFPILHLRQSSDAFSVFFFAFLPLGYAKIISEMQKKKKIAFSEIEFFNQNAKKSKIYTFFLHFAF